MRWSNVDIVREVGRGAFGVVSECKVNAVQLACKEVMVTSAREHDTAAATSRLPRRAGRTTRTRA